MVLRRTLALIAFILAAPPSASAEVDEITVKLYLERFPEVMNASLLERDCPNFAKQELTELAWYIDALITYADNKPELAGGVTAVYQAGEQYDKLHTDSGANFCTAVAPGILEKGLASARAMAGHLGIAGYDPKRIDLAEIEASLEKAAKALGAYDNCREVRRDTAAGVAGRFGGFMFFQSVVGEIKVDYDMLRNFALQHGSTAEFTKRLEELDAEGHRTGPQECSLREYVDLETSMSLLVKRYGLTPSSAEVSGPQIIKPE